MSEIVRAFPSSPTEVRIRVAGAPAPKGSKKGFLNPKNNRVVVVDDNPKTLKQWSGAVTAAAQSAMAELGHPPAMTGPLSMRVVFYLPPPKSLPKWRWLPSTKPDLDKLERATWDALTGVVWRDDAQVVDGARRKLYAIDRTPGAAILVRSLAAVERELGEAWRDGNGPLPRLP